MASTLLTGSDFVTNSNLVQVGQDGSISVDNIRSDDYDVAIVSRDAFDFTSGNKSLRLVFRVSPHTTASRSGLFGAGASGRFASLVDNGTTVEWKGDTFDSSCPGTPDCLTMSRYQCDKFYAVDASSTHTVVKTGQCVGVSGDNTYGQLDITSPETVEGVACGNGFTVIMRNTGLVELIGDDQDGAITIPESCVTFDENDRPIQVVAGENFIAVLKRDGTIVTSGSIDSPENDELFVSISAGSLHFLATSLNGEVFGFGDDTNHQITAVSHKALKVSAAANRSSMLGEDGKIYHWGEGLTGVEEMSSIPTGSQVIDVIAGESFTIAVLKDRTIIVSGSTPAYLDDIVGERIGGKESSAESSDSYDMFPMLRDITGFNMLAGIQEDNLDASYHKYVAADNSVKPIITGRDGYDSVFTGVRGAIKGAVLAKVDNGGDMCFDLNGSDYNPYTATGHLPISTGFISGDENEKYEMILSFSAFGKMIKFRKLSGEYAQEMPFKHLSIEETGYSAGRIALYLRNAKDFILEFAEVTDELDVSLLPPEIIYRDIDTAVLHTKAAEMVIDISDAVEAISDLTKQTSATIRQLNDDYKTNLSDIFSRLETLEGN
jgi:hypothetical protein